MNDKNSSRNSWKLTEVRDLRDSLPVHPSKKPDTQKQIKKIVVHMTNGVVTAQGLAKYDVGPNHISKTGCPTITYHYLIHQFGEIDKCVDHESVTWHAGNHNRKSLAIALNYKADDQWEEAKKHGVGSNLPPKKANRPTSLALQKLLRLLLDLCFTEGVHPTQIFGHRELKGTGWTLSKGSKRFRKTCPGFSVDMEWIREAVARSMQKVLLERDLYNGLIDGDWGKKSKKAFKIYMER